MIAEKQSDNRIAIVTELEGRWASIPARGSAATKFASGAFTKMRSHKKTINGGHRDTKYCVR